jgi:hypothetical protein
LTFRHRRSPVAPYPAAADSMLTVSASAIETACCSSAAAVASAPVALDSSQLTTAARRDARQGAGRGCTLADYARARPRYRRDQGEQRAGASPRSEHLPGT